jgi:hypothetical protein
MESPRKPPCHAHHVIYVQLPYVHVLSFFLSTHIGSVFEKNNHLRALATSLQTSRQRRPLHMSATRIEWFDEWQRSLRTEWASRVECVGRGGTGSAWAALVWVGPYYEKTEYAAHLYNGFRLSLVLRRANMLCICILCFGRTLL